MDYGRNINKEKLVEDAIAKAKELIQEMGENNGIELDEPLLGEEVKVERPKAKKMKFQSDDSATMPKDANEAFAGDMNEG